MIVFLIFLIGFCVSLFISMWLAGNIHRTEKFSSPRPYSCKVLCPVLNIGHYAFILAHWILHGINQ